MGVQRKLESLFAEFMCRLMISFAVGGGSGKVGVGCQVVEFCSSIVRALGHGVLLACSMQTTEHWKGFIGARIELDLHSRSDSAMRMEPKVQIPATRHLRTRVR